MVFELPRSAKNRIWLCEYWNGSRREKRQSTRERKISTRECGIATTLAGAPPAVRHRLLRAVCRLLDGVALTASSLGPGTKSPPPSPPPPHLPSPSPPYPFFFVSRVLDGGGGGCSQPTSVMALVPPGTSVLLPLPHLLQTFFLHLVKPLFLC